MAYVGKAPQTGAYQVLDDISGSFTGSNASTVAFNLTVNGTAVSPGNEANCIISMCQELVQEPQSAFTISGSVRLHFHQVIPHHQILFLEPFLVIPLILVNADRCNSNRWFKFVINIFS